MQVPKKFDFSFFKSKKFFIVSLCVVFLIACTIVANYLSLALVRTNSTSESVSSSAFDVYMLTLAKSQVKAEAEALAGDYQKVGAGGYIWEQDGYFYVVSSVYANKNDATLVQNSVKANQGFDSEIITVHFDEIVVNGSFTADEKKVIAKAISACYDFYYNIYDVAISLDTSVYNEISARLAVNSAHNTLSNIYDDFNTLFEGTSRQLEELGTLLEKSLAISQELCGGTPENQNQTYSSVLKYRYTEILGVLYEFIND